MNPQTTEDAAVMFGMNTAHGAPYFFLTCQPAFPTFYPQYYLNLGFLTSPDQPEAVILGIESNRNLETGVSIQRRFWGFPNEQVISPGEETIFTWTGENNGKNKLTIKRLENGVVKGQYVVDNDKSNELVCEYNASP